LVAEKQSERRDSLLAVFAFEEMRIFLFGSGKTAL